MLFLFKPIENAVQLQILKARRSPHTKVSLLREFCSLGKSMPSPVGEGGSRRLTDEELVWLLVTVQSIEFVSVNAKIRHAFFKTYRILIKLSFSAASPRNNRDLPGSAD